MVVCVPQMAPCLRSLQSLTAHSCSNLALPAFSSLLSLTFLDLSHCAQLSNTSGVGPVGASRAVLLYVLSSSAFVSLCFVAGTQVCHDTAGEPPGLLQIWSRDGSGQGQEEGFTCWEA